MGPEGASKEQGPKQTTDRQSSHQPVSPPQTLPWSQPGSELRVETSSFPGKLIPFVVQAITGTYVLGRAIVPSDIS